MTEIILKKKVDNLGAAGDVVDVKPGYARNYLFPQGLAVRATEGNLKRIAEERRHVEHAEDRRREYAEELAETMEGLSLTFNVRAGEEGQLFGSVSAADVAERLEEEDIQVEQRQIELEEPIKQLGVYTLAVDLHEDVKPELKIWVVARE